MRASHLQQYYRTAYRRSTRNTLFSEGIRLLFGRCLLFVRFCRCQLQLRPLFSLQRVKTRQNSSEGGDMLESYRVEESLPRSKWRFSPSRVFRTLCHRPTLFLARGFPSHSSPSWYRTIAPALYSASRLFKGGSIDIAGVNYPCVRISRTYEHVFAVQMDATVRRRPDFETANAVRVT